MILHKDEKIALRRNEIRTKPRKYDAGYFLAAVSHIRFDNDKLG